MTLQTEELRVLNQGSVSLSPPSEDEYGSSEEEFAPEPEPEDLDQGSYTGFAERGPQTPQAKRAEDKKSKDKKPPPPPPPPKETIKRTTNQKPPQFNSGKYK
ncbi:hypothetical protein M405DRAFT_835449 [Rhizopogon salebrosus TDB-379]|nr:hypothetical protein M405DRAFT_835449 [Rhizopogon salebrosus TDB-379]